MNVKEFSKKIGVSRNTIYKHLRRKSIKGKQHPLTRQWNIPATEVERLQKEIEEG